MITQIIDDTTKIRLVTSTLVQVDIDKAAVKLLLAGNIVYLFDNSFSNQYNQHGEVTIYPLDYTKITSPVTANATALRDRILAILNTGQPVGGDATAANQIIEIAVLNDILTTETNSYGRLGNIVSSTDLIDNKLGRLVHSFNASFGPTTIPGTSTPDPDISIANINLANAIDAELAVIDNLMLINIASDTIYDPIGLQWVGVYRITYSSIN